MVLTKYITKTCILPKMEAENKSDALKELTHLLFDKKKMKDVGPALDQIMSREVTESTGIGRGIAVPHARVAGMKTLACAVGRVPEGLDFMAVDRKPVHLIFLICYPPAEQTTYLNFVATVAKLLGDPEKLKGMLSAPTADDMYDLLEQASENFVAMEDQLKKGEAAKAVGPDKIADAHADLILLARLQLCQEMLQAAKTGKAQIRQRIDNIRSLVDARVISHYDRVMKVRPPALVPVEGDTCQGCFMRLPSKFVQEVRQDPSHIHTCLNCRRYIYVV
ncbi:MAG: PTS sugar transporter subunit IIA [FCB group bacterium]|jgi:mannitol/fructose-specific phosphotransferase system IIA component (Ntr-type)|nr:PTS sugar transporter subunit IIA [FCB group bacterium]